MSDAKKILFRSPSDEPVRVKHENGAVAIVGPEPRELPPLLHTAALKEGCLCDDVPLASRNATAAAPPPPNGNAFDPEKRCKEAIVEIVKRNKPEDFDNQSLPKLKVLSKVAGFTVDKGLLTKCWNELEADAKAAEAAAAAGAQ